MVQPSSETAVRRLLNRFARRRRSIRPTFTVTHATESDPNREFTREESTKVYFFIWLPVFMMLNAVVEKLHVR